MICSNCGTENRPGAKFCTECAAPLAVVCPNCGTANLPGAKFCSECATPLGVSPGTGAGAGAQRFALPPGAASGPSNSATSAGPGAGSLGGRLPAPAGQPVAIGGPTGALPDASVAERRLVTVLFADLVGFTPFAEERDAEEVRETLTRYFDLASEVIGRYGGTVEKFIGDAVMAVWGAPIAREDDAERAVRAALELVDAVRVLGPSIQARAGVLTGEAAVTLGATNQGMVAGDIVNTASRLQSAAPPGSVLVGEATQRSASQSIVFEPAGDQVLKGKTAPVAAWRAVRIVAERGGRNRSDTLEAPFVGRDEELRQLKELFHATGREAKIRLVSVVGPAGIGKTRLAWEFLKYLDGLVEKVWWHAGRSPAYGQGITFWALGEMVRGRAGLLETDDEATTRAKIAAMTREHVPDEAERSWIEQSLLALLGFEANLGSDQLFAAWRTFFERLARTAPVVMVFEDMHYADSGLLDFLDHLMEWSRGVPITVITLARPELLERRPDWGAGKRTFTSIHLEPLSPDAMRQLLAGLVPGLPPGAVAAIVARADGVPLYAVETVRMLLAQGRLTVADGAYHPVGKLDDLAVPETLTALIAARLDALDAADRKLIEDAAVLGQSFTVAGLEAVSGMPVADLEARLRALVRREVLILDVDPRSPEFGQYAFVQALIREVAYNTLSRKDRKVRHLAAARFFESLGTDELAGGLAGHYLAAQRLASDEAEGAALASQARIALRGAAERAAALGSYEQAVQFLDQALEVTTEPADRYELHTRAYESASEGLAHEVVMRHAEAAVQAAREVGDRAAIARAIARHGWAIARFTLDPEAALRLVEPAWEEFQDLADTEAGVDLMIALGRAFGLANAGQKQIAWAERLAPVAERLALSGPLATALIGRGSALIKIDRPREGLVTIRGAHQFALANGLQDAEFGGRVLLTFFEQWNDPAAGLALAREGLEIARRRSSRTYGTGMVGNGVICALRVGEWDWARELLDEWLQIEPNARAYSELHSDRAMVMAVRGDDAAGDLAAEAALRAGVTDPQYESYGEWARAWAAFCAGDFATARERAESAARITSYFRTLSWPLAARAALWLGDAAGARSILDAMEAAPAYGQALELDKATLRAGLAALEGRGAEASSGYRDAIRGWRALGLDFDTALAVVELAAFLEPADRATPEAEAAIEAGRQILIRLEARPFIDRLTAALERPSAPAGQRATGNRQGVPIPR